jgi:hypothetical protein
MHAQTAAWTYVQPRAAGSAERGGYHLILLGDQFASAMRPGLRSQEECRLAFARLLLDHEAMHARHTERNPHIVARAAKQAGITHLDFNLGEDIRIEELGRREFARPFGWIRYQDPPEHPASMAQVALYAAYHAESASSTVLDQIRKDGGSLRQADLVGEYFYLLAHAKTSVDVPPLVAGFLSQVVRVRSPPGDSAAIVVRRRRPGGSGRHRQRRCWCIPPPQHQPTRPRRNPRLREDPPRRARRPDRPHPSRGVRHRTPRRRARRPAQASARGVRGLEQSRIGVRIACRCAGLGDASPDAVSVRWRSEC